MIRLMLLLFEGAVSDEASKKAHELGLTYSGFGYWKDNSGRTVAKTVKGVLTKLDDQPESHDQKVLGWLQDKIKQNPDFLKLSKDVSIADTPELVDPEREKSAPFDPDNQDWMQSLAPDLDNTWMQSLGSKYVDPVSDDDIDTILNPPEKSPYETDKDDFTPEPEAWDLPTAKVPEKKVSKSWASLHPDVVEMISTHGSATDARRALGMKVKNAKQSGNESEVSSAKQEVKNFKTALDNMATARAKELRARTDSSRFGNLLNLDEYIADFYEKSPESWRKQVDTKFWASYYDILERLDHFAETGEDSKPSDVDEFLEDPPEDRIESDADNLLWGLKDYLGSWS
jgi:hypothetical protein